MEITQTQSDGAILLTLSGRLDTNTAPQLQGPLLTGVQSGQDVLIDLNQIDYVSSAGLRVLLVAQKAAKSGGSKLTIQNVQPEVMEVFDITGFSGLLEIV